MSTLTVYSLISLQHVKIKLQIMSTHRITRNQHFLYYFDKSYERHHQEFLCSFLQ